MHRENTLSFVAQEQLNVQSITFLRASDLTLDQFLKTCDVYRKKPAGKKGRSALRKLAASYQGQDDIEDEIALKVCRPLEKENCLYT